MLTSELILELCPRARDGYVSALTGAAGWDTLVKYEVAGHQKSLVGFLATAFHETGGLTVLRESLNYSRPARLREVWPRRFGKKSDEELLKLCHNERELARVVYNGRMGNRPDTDDGFIFRGAGYLQTTGREDFIKYGKLGGIDFSVDPPPSTDDMSLLLIMSAAEWRSGGCNELCINDNFDGANAVINTGSASKISSVVELGERRKWMRRVTQICAQYENILEPAAAESATRGGAGASLKRAPRTFYQTVTRWLGGGPETPEVILHPELADPSSDQGSRRAAHRFDFDESPAVPAS